MGDIRALGYLRPELHMLTAICRNLVPSLQVEGSRVPEVEH